MSFSSAPALVVARRASISSPSESPHEAGSTSRYVVRRVAMMASERQRPQALGTPRSNRNPISIGGGLRHERTSTEARRRLASLLVVVVARRLTGPAVLTRAEAAQVLGVHPATITRWAATGALPSFRTPSGERRYRRCDVGALLNRQDHADRATSPEPVHETAGVETTHQHRLLDLPRQPALSPPAASGRDHGCYPAQPARAAG